ncbi:phage tail protein [Paraburkholderia sp. J8-2]|uniref:phage tail protein n=1 Tax=Paraburkholderia sp. J8-2 TaxID=2805440 RepID=UPI002AB6BE14|nr:phage tail protein [Paraburkholderia sp. J8-2]
MDTFDWVPTVANFSGTTSTVVRSAKFGDGYEQRAADGLNNVSTQYALQFIGGEAKIKAILAFLKAAGGATSFLWTPPLEDAPLVFYSETWTPPTKDGDTWTMTATFQQTFDLQDDE